MKYLTMAAVLLLGGFVFADQALPPAPVSVHQGRVPRQRKRKRLSPEQQMEKFGGFVSKKYEGRYCYFMNAQTRATDASFDWTIQQIRMVLSLPIKLEKTVVQGNDNFSPLRTAWAEGKNAGAVVSVVDLPGWSTLLVAPEDGWVQVNIAPLAKDNPSSEILDRRVKKELWRAFVMLFGGGNSSMIAGDLMRPVTSLADLDAMPNLAPGPEPFNAVMQGARARGITPIYRNTYKRACEEGWAPAPTNDVQRAIFEQVKADKERGPTNPLKITPPNAKK